MNSVSNNKWRIYFFTENLGRILEELWSILFSGKLVCFHLYYDVVKDHNNVIIHPMFVIHVIAWPLSSLYLLHNYVN